MAGLVLRLACTHMRTYTHTDGKHTQEDTKTRQMHTLYIHTFSSGGGNEKTRQAIKFSARPNQAPY